MLGSGVGLGVKDCDGMGIKGFVGLKVGVNDVPDVVGRPVGLD